MKYLVAVANIFFAISTFAQNPIAPRPETRISDMWVYSGSDALTNRALGDYQLTVTQVTDQGYRIEAKRVDAKGRLIVMLFDNDSNRVEWIYRPAKKLFSFPLEEGKEWSTHYVWNTDDARGEIKYDGSVKVEGWENVTVPAGTFKALRIKSINNWRIEGNGRRGSDTDTLWYVPGVKRSVKYTFRVEVSGSGVFRHETYELKEFKIASGP